jgi:hypothetical protein
VIAVRIELGVENVMVHGNERRGHKIVNEAGPRALLGKDQPRSRIRFTGECPGIG